MTKERKGSDRAASEGATPDAERKASRERKTYKKPSLVVLGSLADMTRAMGNQGAKDGSKKPYWRTH